MLTIIIITNYRHPRRFMIGKEFPPPFRKKRNVGSPLI